MSAASDFLSGGGEMGRRIRALDWSATALGPIEDWPQSLRSAVSILLPSKAQIALFWGEDLVTIYNDAYRPVFGAKHPRALGQPIRQSWDELWRAGLKELFDGVLSTGEAFWAQDRPFFMERHGYLEETYFDVSYDPVRDESGGVAGVFCIVSEKTGNVLGERRLRTLRDLDRIPALAQSVDEVHQRVAQVLEANRADLPFALLYAPGSGGARLVAQVGLEGHAAAAAQLPSPTAPWPLAEEPMVLGADRLAPCGPLHAGPWPEPVREAMVLPLGAGAVHGWLVCGASPRRQLDGGYQDFLAMVANNVAAALDSARRAQDERRRAEMLAELDRAKTAFFSNVSHEFRTPLTLLMGPLDDALGDADHPLDAAQRDRLVLARRSAARLHKLVNTLLEFSRVEAGRAQARFAPTDLAVLTAELASSFRSAMEKAGLRLVVDCPPLPAPAYVDRDLWEKIVLNLLSNAFKFTFAGEVAVRLREGDGTFVLTVQDTGVGIPADELPKVFDRFHRVAGARSRTHEGSGIGLALVQELARLHGGSARADSREGAGSVFTVTVPAGSAHLDARQVAGPGGLATTAIPAEAYVEEALRWLPGEAGAAVATAGSRPRIVLADDNADMRDYIRNLLAGSYEVEAVADGQEALEAVRTRGADLVLADVMMPRLDGLALARRLREQPELAAVPVVLLSARAGEGARIEGLDAGADDYVEKPFAARELLARVAARLEIAALRRRAEAQLQEADRRKDEFIATLSHELRNPLAPLRNGLQLLRLKGGAAGDSLLQMMERQVNQLVRLVDDLLELSRISRGTLNLRREPVDLRAVIQQAVESCEPLVRECGHSLEVELPDQPLWLDGDAARLTQVLANLLNNASRYTERGGRIVVTASADGERARVAVRDTGMGFDAAQAARLFQMFSRGERSQGLGIGLALARTLAEMHGGEVTAHSEGPGQGATFTLELPLRAAAPQPAPVATPAPGMDALRVLVVDDNRDAAVTLQTLLELLGARAEVAHDGAQALAHFAECDPQVVLLDIGMPGMDGYAVARELRRRHPSWQGKLIALTGWGQENDRRKGREAGFDHHLVKPVDVAALQALLAPVAPAAGQPPSGERRLDVARQ
ncbi:MAG: ATP-binding protein [Ramlibacter sp.]